MRVLTLDRFSEPDVASVVARATSSAGLTNVFNASAIRHGSCTYVAVRAESFPGEKPFRAYIVAFKTEDSHRVIDLSTIAAEYGIPKTADPKLVALHGEIFVTFNTGNVHTGTNDIYLQRITPTLGPPQRCVLAPRRMVEKNWGFYSLPGEGLRVVYSLAPLTLLRLSSGSLDSVEDLQFTPIHEAPMPPRFPRLHIGSQPLIISPERALIAGNQQVPIPGLPRKIYFGRIAAVDLRSGTLTRLSRRALVHSLQTMLPQRRTHNPGLLSATYFAGLTHVDDDLLLSYGYNDKRIGVARVTEDVLWR